MFGELPFTRFHPPHHPTLVLKGWAQAREAASPIQNYLELSSGNTSPEGTTPTMAKGREGCGALWMSAFCVPAAPRSTPRGRKGPKGEDRWASRVPCAPGPLLSFQLTPTSHPLARNKGTLQWKLPSCPVGHASGLTSPLPGPKAGL